MMNNNTLPQEVVQRVEEYRRKGYPVLPLHLLKTPNQIQGLRESGKINVAVLDYVAAHIRPGISTEEIDRWVYEETLRLGGIPAPLNYQGFPKSVCTSLNDQVCHGIPSKDVILKEGDILNVDVSTIFNGFYSDSSRMFMMGEVSPQRQKLVRITKESVEEGLKQVKPWSRLGNVGYAVHQHARRNGCSVVREVGGHGIGLEFHEEPFVSFVSHRNSGEVLVPGMVFTIEPMVNSGSAHVYVDDADGWTIYTADGSDSAQWEVQVLVTETGYEVLAW